MSARCLLTFPVGPEVRPEIHYALTAPCTVAAGLEKVRGRSIINWDEKSVIALWYLANQGLMLDIIIFLRIFKRVVSRYVISSAGETTMPGSTGSLALQTSEEAK